MWSGTWFSALIIGLFSQQILWFKLNKAYPSYRIENYYFSWGIARQHPILGIGLSSPRKNFCKTTKSDILTLIRSNFQ